ncbi:Bifunctional Heparan Sulfate N-Deacetylase/N-Sulfotransferase 4 [Manis pentadactyla]|nr:Bifunctional Heparan Sulfate N-Deacetylase/N-Sulfotransferase 4 [Manis pentadactyla]
MNELRSQSDFSFEVGDDWFLIHLGKEERKLGSDLLTFRRKKKKLWSEKVLGIHTPLVHTHGGKGTKTMGKLEREAVVTFIHMVLSPSLLAWTHENFQSSRGKCEQDQHRTLPEWN